MVCGVWNGVRSVVVVYGVVVCGVWRVVWLCGCVRCVLLRCVMSNEWCTVVWWFVCGGVVCSCSKLVGSFG